MVSQPSVVKLSSSTISGIKSSVVINSLNDVVVGLIQNSLDAQATNINIQIDYAAGSCVVEDDGTGILPSEFETDCNLTKLHYSSKFIESDEVHDRNGCFLHSVAALATLTIISKHQDHLSTNLLSVKESNIISRQAPIRDAIQLCNEAGTKVLVRDLFANIPVRVKHRLTECAIRPNLRKKHNELVKNVTALLLAWNNGVAISIASTALENALSIKSESGYKNRSLVNPVVSVLYQAKFVSTPERASWIPVEARTRQMKVRGTICLDPAPTKNVQFLSLNIIPLLNADSYTFLYDSINRCFVNSSFGMLGFSIDKDEKRAMKNCDYKVNKSSARRTGVEKGIDRWPMFYLRINLRSKHGHDVIRILEHGEASNDRDDLFRTVNDLLQMMSVEFLRKHHFRPTHTVGTLQNESKITSNRIRASSIDDDREDTLCIQASTDRPKSIVRKVSNLSNDLGTNTKLPPFLFNSTQTHVIVPKVGCSRMKSSIPRSNIARSEFDGSFENQLSRGPVNAASGPSESASFSDNNVWLRSPTRLSQSIGDNISSEGKLLRQPSHDTVNTPVSLNSSSSRTSEKSFLNENIKRTALSWINPVTRVQSTIDSRTGFELSTGMKRVNSMVLRRPHDNSTGKIVLSKGTGPVHGDEFHPVWLSNVLKTWINPVFQLTKTAIPQVVAIDSKHRFKDQGAYIDVDQAFRSISGKIGSISRQSLKQATVLAQVDLKFILINIESQDGQNLVLVDQHAADERCRVEELFSQYCQLQNPGSNYIKTSKLERPITIELMSTENQLLHICLQRFERWGIRIRARPITDIAVQVMRRHEVTHLPPIILERCRLDPELLVKLIRTELWKQTSTKSLTHNECSTDKMDNEHSLNLVEVDHSWITKIHDCPQGVLDILNSRACRSAVMFNDKLNLDQCRSLISRMANCEFPFQCAHGRPSMVPLVDLNTFVAVEHR